MIQIDLHVHSSFSSCGLHTFLELINGARSLGMKGIAITDHGLTLGGRLNSVFYERFKCPYPDFHLLKGIECNFTSDNGEIDLPKSYLQYLDVVLLGIHPNTEKKLGKEHYTSMVISGIEKNKAIDIITHPNDPAFPVDYEAIAEAAKKEGVALELNNSKILYSRSDIQDAVLLVAACKKVGCSIAVNSDTHAIHELGLDDSVKPLLQECDFPSSLIVNRDAESTLHFLNARKERKN